jgi:hypothetical protein
LTGMWPVCREGACSGLVHGRDEGVVTGRVSRGHAAAPGSDDAAGSRSAILIGATRLRPEARELGGGRCCRRCRAVPAGRSGRWCPWRTRLGVGGGVAPTRAAAGAARGGRARGRPRFSRSKAANSLKVRAAGPPTFWMRPRNAGSRTASRHPGDVVHGHDDIDVGHRGGQRIGLANIALRDLDHARPQMFGSARITSEHPNVDTALHQVTPDQCSKSTGAGGRKAPHRTTWLRTASSTEPVVSSTGSRKKRARAIVSPGGLSRDFGHATRPGCSLVDHRLSPVGDALPRPDVGDRWHVPAGAAQRKSDGRSGGLPTVMTWGRWWCR